MRLAALIPLALTLSVGVAVGGSLPAAGTLEIKDERGFVQVTGKGVVVGRVDKGSLKIVDLTPGDQWSPWVNGVPRGKVVWLKGRDITFRISSGRYRIVANGDGISVSARGNGTVALDGDPDPVGDTGMYRIGDAQLVPVPDEATKASFGGGDRSVSSASSVKIP